MKKKHLGIRIVGTYAPPLGFERDDKELEKINQMISNVNPDLLIACLDALSKKNGFTKIYQSTVQKCLFVQARLLISCW